MKIGVWNIDHPEVGTRSRVKHDRLERILNFLKGAKCDIYVLSETNLALTLPEYQAQFSDESPFKRKSRSYEHPNDYRQVAVYSRHLISKTDIPEPINGVFCHVLGFELIENLYGSVVTIKDQWKKDSSLKYTDRLIEQINAIKALPNKRTIVAGDFNLRLGWPQKAKAHDTIAYELENQGWVWPTKQQTYTVQHVLHTPDVSVEFSIDQSVKENKLSDHPFLLINVSN